MVVLRAGKSANRRLSWRQPSERAKASQANQVDVTETGAYSVALATVESELRLFAISRAEVRTGADYYICPAGDTGLEHAYRLEVSGTHSDTAALRARLKEKIRQAEAGQDDLPALACVVGFSTQEIALEPVRPMKRSGRKRHRNGDGAR
jgi:hypothetical protein